MRITNSDLDQAVKVLNKTAGNKSSPYSKMYDCLTHKISYDPNPNVYLLDFAYGAVALNQPAKTGTGEREIIPRTTKKELYNRIHSFTEGLQKGLESAEKEKIT